MISFFQVRQEGRFSIRTFGNRSQLKITKMKHEDSGHFVVRASNFIGASATEFYLNVPTEEAEAEEAEGKRDVLDLKTFSNLLSTL